jgi:hypothetical protein
MSTVSGMLLPQPTKATNNTINQPDRNQELIMPIR